MKQIVFEGWLAKFRLDHAHDIATAILGLCALDPTVINAVDVGAGKGIWSRMLVARSLRSVSAAEPNDDMCGPETETSKHAVIAWRKSSAEVTELPNGPIDLATMALCV